ncbi:hypothetical protein [Pontibacter pamirensis]|uniref:hypothetical protein n=1 Tax=Pontibacter pamirensis TaxID=2562824 RepID=UPI0013898A7C|nr:hypothetical protein [Pontibacter pamirensis]
MKTNFTVCAFSLILFFLHSPLRAQTQEIQIDNPNKLALHSIGATFGFGVADINVDALNARLQAAGIDQFYDQLSNGTNLA